MNATGRLHVQFVIEVRLEEVVLTRMVRIEADAAAVGFSTWREFVCGYQFAWEVISNLCVSAVVPHAGEQEYIPLQSINANMSFTSKYDLSNKRASAFVIRVVDNAKSSVNC